MQADNLCGAFGSLQEAWLALTPTAHSLGCLLQAAAITLCTELRASRVLVSMQARQDL